MEQLEYRPITPTAILAIYQPPSENKYYIEKHDVVDGKVQAGVPLERKSLRQMAKTILDKDVQNQVGLHGLCPQNLLSFSMSNGEKKLLWLVRAQKRPMFFTPDMNIPDGVAHQPHLVFFVDGRDLSLFAVKDENITPETALFLPPFHNLSDRGEVCLGTTQRKDSASLEELMSHWEHAFYYSYFSHTGNLHTRLSFNINSFWKKLIETQCKFPEDALLPSKKISSIQDLLDQITIKTV